MKAILVSYQYSDLLVTTLPRNIHHFESVHVVTAPQDVATIDVAKVCGAQVYQTDAFWRHGAAFNKWLALEEALDDCELRKSGWLCLMDADVIWPQKLPVFPMEKGFLYAPLRRMFFPWPRHLPAESEWTAYPLHSNVQEWAGYSQIFHADDPVLGSPPWHETNWTHAGGADSFFQAKWPAARKVRPPFEVLHLGEAGVNWAGRVTPYADGTRPAEADARAERLRQVFAGRRGKQGMARFEHERLR